MNRDDRIAMMMRLGGRSRPEATEMIDYMMARRWVNHQFEEREDSTLRCSVCKASEGALPDECPGYAFTIVEGIKIYRGELNYRHGKWRNEHTQSIQLLLSCRGTDERQKTDRDRKEIAERQKAKDAIFDRILAEPANAKAILNEHGYNMELL